MLQMGDCYIKSNIYRWCTKYQQEQPIQSNYWDYRNFWWSRQPKVTLKIQRRPDWFCLTTNNQLQKRLPCSIPQSQGSLCWRAPMRGYDCCFERQQRQLYYLHHCCASRDSLCSPWSASSVYAHVFGLSPLGVLDRYWALKIPDEEATFQKWQSMENVTDSVHTHAEGLMGKKIKKQSYKIYCRFRRTNR